MKLIETRVEIAWIQRSKERYYEPHSNFPLECILRLYISASADTYRLGTDAAIDATLQLLTDRARYDAEYAANKTDQLAAFPEGMKVNMTAALTSLATAVSVDLAAMDTVGRCRLTL